MLYWLFNMLRVNIIIAIVLSVVMLNALILCVVPGKPSIIQLNAIILSVIMVIVVAPFVVITAGKSG